MTIIEDRTNADRARAELEDCINEGVTALIQARHYHHQLDHHRASCFTVRAQRALSRADELEEALVDWQDRAEEQAQEVPC